MNTNTAIASFDSPRHSYFFFEDTEGPGMATSRQKQNLKDLIFQNIEDSETQEVCLNQLRDLSEVEASLWIKQMEEGMW